MEFHLLSDKFSTSVLSISKWTIFVYVLNSKIVQNSNKKNQRNFQLYNYLIVWYIIQRISNVGLFKGLINASCTMSRFSKNEISYKREGKRNLVESNQRIVCVDL